jgi:hypothetical protein
MNDTTPTQEELFTANDGLPDQAVLYGIDGRTLTLARLADRRFLISISGQRPIILDRWQFNALLSAMMEMPR